MESYSNPKYYFIHAWYAAPYFCLVLASIWLFRRVTRWEAWLMLVGSVMGACEVFMSQFVLVQGTGLWPIQDDMTVPGASQKLRLQQDILTLSEKIGSWGMILFVVGLLLFAGRLRIAGSVRPITALDATPTAPSVLTVRQKVMAVLVAVLLIGSFSIVIIGAGCGAGPVGLLLVMGSFSAWGLHMTLGWIGMVLTVAALFCSQAKLHIPLATAGLACVAVSWSEFFMASEVSGGTLVTSIPFFVLSLIRAVQLWRIWQLTAA
jgi:hypothetical protein